MTQEDLLELAHAFHDATADELGGAETPAQFQKVTRRAQQRIDQLFAGMVEEDRVPIACRAGCSFCCHLKVETRAQDVFLLAAWLRKHFSDWQRGALLSRLGAHVKRLAGLSIDEQIGINYPCPLLEDGRCSAYAARPSSCRIAHSMDVGPCQYAFDHPEDLDAPSGADMEVRLGLRVANDGVAWAYREAGYDDQLYHLSAALAEALTDVGAEARWRAKGRAFSDAALARPDGDDDVAVGVE